MGGDYRRARAFVDREYGDQFVMGPKGWWYAPLVDAFVKGAQAARRAARRSQQQREGHGKA